MDDFYRELRKSRMQNIKLDVELFYKNEALYRGLANWVTGWKPGDEDAILEVEWSYVFCAAAVYGFNGSAESYSGFKKFIFDQPENIFDCIDVLYENILLGGEEVPDCLRREYQSLFTLFYLTPSIDRASTVNKEFAEKQSLSMRAYMLDTYRKIEAMEDGWNKLRQQ